VFDYIPFPVFTHTTGMTHCQALHTESSSNLPTSHFQDTTTPAYASTPDVLPSRFPDQNFKRSTTTRATSPTHPNLLSFPLTDQEHKLWSLLISNTCSLHSCYFFPIGYRAVLTQQRERMVVDPV